MMSPEGKRIKAALFNGQPTQTIPLAVERQSWEEAAAQVVLPPSIIITPATMNGVTGEWVSSPDADPQSVLFYLHGGGYTAGSAITHRELAARLSLASGMRLLLINYRLAPEDPFPAAVEDAGNSFRWLLDCGIAPTQIVIGGDSAGGGLALATLVWLRQHHLALPAAALLLSPWLDLALTGASLQSHAAVDPLVTKAELALAANRYLANADAKTPLASPLYADLQGLPPLLIQVGSDEVLLSDATRLAELAQAAGVETTLEVWDGMWHVWHAWAAELPEGQQAITRIGEFIRQQWPQK